VDLTEKFLKLGGFDTITSYSAKKAMKIIEESYDKIDLILLNIMVPGLGGYTVLEKVKNNEKFKNIPVELIYRYEFTFSNRGSQISGKDLIDRLKKILRGEEVERGIYPTRSNWVSNGDWYPIR